MGEFIHLFIHLTNTWQGRNRDTDVENKRTDTKGGKRGEREMNWEIGVDVYTLICIK